MGGALPGGGQCPVDKGGVGVDVKDLGEDGVFELAGGEPFVVAGGCSVALAGEAGVVAVGVAASFGVAADEPGSAAVTDDQPGEQVVRPVRRPQGVAVSSGDEDLLCLVEHVGVDERWVGGRVVAVPEVHLSEVGAVA
ncbi:MAG TPA: hypothetical protein VKU88_12340 [Acidimicrobiales bacterium]|nr:hypothetical protein [Acidimicrobiales bacterium]